MKGKLQFTPAGMPEAVAHVFNRACKDCHSNSTAWPWYAKIPPISLAIAGDVQSGRSFLNMSDWDEYSRGRKLGILSAMQIAVAKSNMPPRAYRWMHHESILSRQDRELIANWAIAERVRLRSASPW
ncbi:MAG: heme-binding domain-containing protein [Acidobacteriota bacterium]|nr:heme-binding domain-containing protein [Acidobacteriota bacterium]